jgi:hypothetical protein
MCLCACVSVCLLCLLCLCVCVWVGRRQIDEWVFDGLSCLSRAAHPSPWAQIFSSRSTRCLASALARTQGSGRQTAAHEVVKNKKTAMHAYVHACVCACMRVILDAMILESQGCRSASVDRSAWLRLFGCPLGRAWELPYNGSKRYPTLLPPTEWSQPEGPCVKVTTFGVTFGLRILWEGGFCSNS